MWIQKDSLNKEISWSDVLDWVVINGVLWVEVTDEEEMERCIAPC